MKNKSADDIEHVLELDAPPHTPFWQRWRWIAPIIIGVGVVAYFWIWQSDDSQARYSTQIIGRGNVTIMVSATGTIQPTNEVQVGTEVSGTIETVTVDANDVVAQGDLLARLDLSRFEAQVLQAEAALAAARAMEAEAEAIYTEARLILERTQRLAERSIASQEELDAAQASFERADAGVASARAQVLGASADLAVDETNLAKAHIKAPIDGVVLSRNVDPGQTVAASLQTPVLFTLAANLTSMELHVDVDEADVAKIRAGQEASFTVDAYPDHRFRAEIVQVSFAPSSGEGVVTYETILSVDNSDLRLRPGMTATVEIVVDRLADALLVPNEAFRYTMPASAGEQAQNNGGLVGQLLPRMPRQNDSARLDETGLTRHVWVLRDGDPVELVVTIGQSDGRLTEIVGGELAAGDEVITGADG